MNEWAHENLPAVNTANTGLPVVVLSYVIDLVSTFHSGDASATSTVKSRGHSSVRARQTPETVTAARRGQIQPAALASRSVVTGSAAFMLFLWSINNKLYVSPKWLHHDSISYARQNSICISVKMQNFAKTRKIESCSFKQGVMYLYQF